MGWANQTRRFAMSRDAEALIQVRAYEIWEREGRPHGRDREHWFQAVKELIDGVASDIAEVQAAAPELPKKAKARPRAKIAAAEAAPPPVAKGPARIAGKKMPVR
jgi:hypothetical protein